MKLAAFDSHRAARVQSQRAQFWLIEVPCLALVALAMVLPFVSRLLS